MNVLDRLRGDRFVFVSIALLALIAWGGILFAPNALYWDDWVLANDDTLRMTSELGIPWLGYIDMALFAVGPWSFKVVVIVSTIIIGCLTYAISGRGLGLSRNERWLLAALVVTLPLMSPRVIVSLSHYSWSLALFMIAWYLLVARPPQRAGRARYIAAGVLLFASYTTGSLLPFTALPVLHLAVLRYQRGQPIIRQALRFAGKYWLILATPIAFWTVRTLFLQPYGLYANYNSVGEIGLAPAYIRHGARGFAAALVVIPAVLAYRTFGRRPTSAAVRHVLVVVLLSAMTVGLAVYLYLNRPPSSPLADVVLFSLAAAGLLVALLGTVDAVLSRNTIPRTGRMVPVLALGLFILILGVLPYLLVGKLPSSTDWESRHQLLMPFGVGVILVSVYGVVVAMGLKRIARVYAGTLVAIMLSLSVAASLSLVADGNKQIQVSAALATSEVVRESNIVVFSDAARDLNYDHRSYSFYEYNGWMMQAFGDQTRLGLDMSNLLALFKGDFEATSYPASRYGFEDWERGKKYALAQIDTADGATWWTLLINQPAVTVTVMPIEELESLAGRIRAGVRAPVAPKP